MIRLIATDLDGTLLRTDGTVSQRSVDALRAVADAGLDDRVDVRVGSALDPLPDSAVKAALEAFADYVVGRSA